MGEGNEQIDRRPIASRNWALSQRTADLLSKSGISANAISVGGMICGIASGIALAATSTLPEYARAFWLAGAAFAQLRLLANMFDGMVAIQRGEASPVGELYNEVPDRISDSAIFIGLGYALGGSVVLGFVAACVALFVAYVRATGKAAGAPNDFCGPMAKQHRMAIVTFTALGCGFAPDTWLPEWRGWGIPAAALAIIAAGGAFTALRRLARAGSYLRKHSR
ncbi:MAG: CDP-alcohol phosphatidyltransferase family protein [Candidatus Hydrogenedentes bacterium]|nr:CDP-alcohol phosphatidyltransferase family protein [Candidatus Hydrogenedentota bacterium]